MIARADLTAGPFAKGERSVRLGLVGFGRLAREYYVRALRNVDGASIVAVADPREESRAAAQRAFPRASCFAAHREMLDREPLDGVLVASPPSAHLAAWVDATRAGVPVFMEKPFVLSGELERATDCASAGRGLMINFNRRFWPPYQRMGKLARSGAVGRVRSARFTLQVNVKAWCSVTQHRLSPAEGGVLYDLGSQVLDLACEMFGSQPQGVRATLSGKESANDHVQIELRLANGVQIECRLAYDVPTRESIVIRGSDGELRMDDPNRALHLVRKSSPGGFALRALKDAFVFAGRAMCREYSMSRYTIRTSLRSFVQTVREGGVFSPGFEDAVRNSLLLHAAGRSAAERREVVLEPMTIGRTT